MILTDEEIFKYLPQEESVMEFARAIESAVLEKLAAQGVEPVAYQHRDGMLSCRLPGGHVAGIDWTLLFTETQLLAAQRRTAEACAMMLDDFEVHPADTAVGVLNEHSEAIRNGEWKNYYEK